MADPTTKSFTQLIQGQAAAVQARAAGLADYTLGSILRAVGEAVSGTALWLQGQILVLLQTTRAATSQLADLDSWVGDFGAAPTAADETIFSRLPAAAGTTAQAFSRISTSGTAVVPVGAAVQTLDGSVKFTVTLDTGNGNYNAGLGGYVMADTVGSISVPVAATVPGLAGNVVAGAINTITSAIPGVSGTTNASAVSNGADAETDDQMRARFRAFLLSLRAATPKAMAYGVMALQRGVTCVAVENFHHDGTPEKGYSYFVVDDGTGSPSSDLLTAAAVALDDYHAAGTSFSVYAPTVVTIAVTASLVTVAGADHAQAIAEATVAVTTYLNTLPIGATVFWSRVWQVLQDASDDITEVTGLVVHGGTADVTMLVYQVAKAGTLAIT